MVLVPKGSRSLLRRTALSARGRGSRRALGSRRQQNPVSRLQRSSTTSGASSPSSPSPSSSPEPVRLYDRPVSISEWIDLGSASLESSDSPHILSRVQDAESQILSSQFLQDEEESAKSTERQLPQTDLSSSPPSHPPHPPLLELDETEDAGSTKQEPQGEMPVSLAPTPPAQETPSSPPPPSAAHTKSNLESRPLRPSPPPSSPIPSKKLMDASQRPSRSKSWFGGFFGDKDKKRKVEDERYAQKQIDDAPRKPSPSTPTPNGTLSSSKKSSLGSFFSRSKAEFKSKLQSPPPLSTSAALFHNNNGNNAALHQQQAMTLHSYRLPINVERAIYRLSHFKLADPRRPLRHQVVISNLMFWYLSIIHQQQQQQQQDTSTVPTPSPSSSSTQPASPSRIANDPTSSSPSSPTPSFVSPNANVNEAAPQSRGRPLTSKSKPVASPQNDEDDMPLSFFKAGA
ncbi:hypothetical protein DM01DRAFT_1112369 [Hesseltinella vesiculosa]|uniref:Protein Zds1 C-terminal domain-containing protein n=1 Tax=Hesseltinella vesiculosa TaxID=101127 RepID=A0A1X2G9V1_9FUNG|nr:hypothetical protein DM01DRAFT_1112369 [Hesseltinella vesiculosa]